MEKVGLGGCFLIIILLIIPSIYQALESPVKRFFYELKSPSDKLELRLTERVEAFAKEELPSFIKNRDDIANTIVKITQKRKKHIDDAHSIKSNNAKTKLLKEAERLGANIVVIRKKAEDINTSIEDLYAIKETEDKSTFDTKIRAILKKSEDLKAEASAMASDMENAF